MKKVFAVAALSIFVLSLSSCVKTRSCNCSDGYSFSVTGTKAASKTACESYDSGCSLGK